MISAPITPSTCGGRGHMPRSPNRIPSCPVEGMTVSSKHTQESRSLLRTAFEACSAVKGASGLKKHLQASKEVPVTSRPFIRVACSRANEGHISHKASSMSEALKTSMARRATPQKLFFAMDPSMMSPGLQVKKPKCVTCMPSP